MLLLRAEGDGVVGGESHGFRSLDYSVIIAGAWGGWRGTVPPSQLAHPAFPVDTPDIESPPVPVPLFRVVDTNTRNLQHILYHNTFFHVSGAENRLPTASGVSVHAKEFLYTTPRPYTCPFQSETLWGAATLPQCHNTHLHPHVSDRDGESPPQSGDVERIYSETKR